MSEKFKALDSHLRELTNLMKVRGLLGWDQQVLMPPGGVGARAGQIATISRITHELLTSPETARLLEAAAAEVANADYDSYEASLVRIAHLDYDEATKLPVDFVTEMARVIAEAREIWASARARSDFASFQPTLERIIALKRREADYYGYSEHPYDALVNRYERGMTTARIRAIFDAHRQQLVNLVAEIGQHEARVDDTMLHQRFPVEQQREFALWAVRKIGFDFQRGRQDVSVHPFANSFARGDVRITTRFNEDFLNPALFGMMHEAGHGMYEQGVAPELDGTMLGSGTSLGVHESQSRMWENLVGRSKGFWQWALPRLQEVFPQQLGSTDLDTFYRAINKVRRQFIRVEADEATYNLHIMLRFEIEAELLAGQLAVAELPRIWNERFEAAFGIVPPTDTLGVLQDVHWSSGLVGYFPTYALGNLLSVQYFNRALQDHPQIPDEIAQGKFDTLLAWLNTHIHRHGRKFTSEELTERVTGTHIDPAPYITYLTDKFTSVYNL